MRISVPVEVAVYYRKFARGPYTLHHIARGSYSKHLPLSLNVTDLRQHALHAQQDQDHEKTPLLVLVTGTKVRKLHLRNWDTRQKATPLTPRDLQDVAQLRPPAADDLNDEEFAMLRTYATLVSFTANAGQKYAVQHTASIEAAAIVVPRKLNNRDILRLERHFRFALQKAKDTSTWMLLDPQETSPMQHFNEDTGRCKTLPEWIIENKHD